MLDRIALYVSPAALADGTAYTRAMRARQRTLEVRGTNLKAAATAHRLPFDDVEKKKRTAVG